MSVSLGIRVMALFSARLTERANRASKIANDQLARKMGKGSGFGSHNTERRMGDEVEWESPKWRQYDASDKRNHKE